MFTNLETRYAEAKNSDLMEKFYAGDDDALELLVRRLRVSLLHQAYRQLPRGQVGRRQVAEDVVQITWIKVAATRQRPDVRWDPNKRAVRTWIGTILRNVIVSHLRAHTNRQPVVGDWGREPGNGWFASIESRLADHRMESEAWARQTEQLRRQMIAAVDRLPEKARAILSLKLDGYSHQQIAQRLGLSKSTIGYHFRTAKQLLRAETLAA